MEWNSFTVDGIPVEYLHGGQGTPLMMIHGSGPGASTLGNWSKVLEPLAGQFEVFAMDLVGFGRSGKKSTPPYFDFGFWLTQCRALLDRIPGPRVGLIGHSVSGALALTLASENARVARVMTTGTMGAIFEPNDGTNAAWSFPVGQDQLVAAARMFIHDHTLIDEPYLAQRRKTLNEPGYQAYFSAMFAGDKRQYIKATVVPPETLKKIQCDVLMVHGRQDVAFPAEPLTLTMMEHIPHADVVLLGRCSHSVAFEYPEKLLSLARDFFAADAP